MADFKPAGAELSASGAASRLRSLVEELRELEERLRQGGGPDRIQRQHDQGAAEQASTYPSHGRQYIR